MGSTTTLRKLADPVGAPPGQALSYSPGRAPTCPTRRTAPSGSTRCSQPIEGRRIELVDPPGTRPRVVRSDEDASDGDRSLTMLRDGLPAARRAIRSGCTCRRWRRSRCSRATRRVNAGEEDRTHAQAVPPQPAPFVLRPGGDGQDARKECTTGELPFDRTIKVSLTERLTKEQVSVSPAAQPAHAPRR